MGCIQANQADLQANRRQMHNLNQERFRRKEQERDQKRAEEAKERELERQLIAEQKERERLEHLDENPETLPKKEFGQYNPANDDAVDHKFGEDSGGGPVEEFTVNTILWYYLQMDEFQERSSDTKWEDGGAWMRPLIDEKPTVKQRAPMAGHLKNGVAHGIGTITIRQKMKYSAVWKYHYSSEPSDQIAYQYDGTFVNGVMHGYGRLLHICSDGSYSGQFKDSFYEGEFQNGVAHGYGKLVFCDDESATKEGYWEHGSMISNPKVGKFDREYNLDLWKDRQDELLLKHKSVKQKEKELEMKEDMEIKKWQEVMKKRIESEQGKQSEGKEGTQHLEYKPQTTVDLFYQMISDMNYLKESKILPDEYLEGIFAGNEEDEQVRTQKLEHVRTMLTEIITCLMESKILNDYINNDPQTGADGQWTKPEGNIWVPRRDPLQYEALEEDIDEHLKKFKSKIITDKYDFQFVKNKLFGDMGIPKLIFRFSKHGRGSADFHRCCDDKPNTIMFIKSKPYRQELSDGDEEVIIGGFTSVAWESPDPTDPNFKHGVEDEKAFLFSVTKRQKLNAKKNQTTHQNNIDDCAAFGYDLTVTTYGKVWAQCFPDKFEEPLGIQCQDEDKRKLLMKKWLMGSNQGSFNGEFSIDQLEVFQFRNSDDDEDSQNSDADEESDQTDFEDFFRCQKRNDFKQDLLGNHEIYKAYWPRIAYDFSLFDSKIICSKKDFNYVHRVLPYSYRGVPVLIYRASRDGTKCSDFHRCCDGKRNTMALIKSLPENEGDEQVIIGGYAPDEWKTPDHEDPNYEETIKNRESFLFSVTRQYKLKGGTQSNNKNSAVKFGQDLVVGENQKVIAPNFPSQFEFPIKIQNDPNDPNIYQSHVSSYKKIRYAKKWLLGNNNGEYEGEFTFQEFEVFQLVDIDKQNSNSDEDSDDSLDLKPEKQQSNTAYIELDGNFLDSDDIKSEIVERLNTIATETQLHKNMNETSQMEESLKKFVDQAITFSTENGFRRDGELMNEVSFDLSQEKDNLLARTIFESTMKLIKECQQTSKDKDNDDFYLLLRYRSYLSMARIEQYGKNIERSLFYHKLSLAQVKVWFKYGEFKNQDMLSVEFENSNKYCGPDEFQFMFHIMKCEHILLGQKDDTIKSADGVISYIYYWQDQDPIKERYKQMKYDEQMANEKQTDRFYNFYMAHKTLARIYENQGSILQAIIHYQDQARIINGYFGYDHPYRKVINERIDSLKNGIIPDDNNDEDSDDQKSSQSQEDQISMKLNPGDEMSKEEIDQAFQNMVETHHNFVTNEDDDEASGNTGKILKLIIEKLAKWRIKQSIETLFPSGSNHTIKSIINLLQQIKSEAQVEDDEILIIIFTSLDHKFLINGVISEEKFKQWFKGYIYDNDKIDDPNRYQYSDEKEFLKNKEKEWGDIVSYVKWWLHIEENDAEGYKEALNVISEDKQFSGTAQKELNNLRFKQYAKDFKNNLQEKPHLITEIKVLFIEGNNKCSHFDFYYFIKIKMHSRIELMDWEKEILQKRIGKDYIKKNAFYSFLREHGIDVNDIFQENFQEESIKEEPKQEEPEQEELKQSKSLTNNQKSSTKELKYKDELDKIIDWCNITNKKARDLMPSNPQQALKKLNNISEKLVLNTVKDHKIGDDRSRFFEQYIETKINFAIYFRLQGNAKQSLIHLQTASNNVELMSKSRRGWLVKEKGPELAHIVDSLQDLVKEYETVKAQGQQNSSLEDKIEEYRQIIIQFKLLDPSPIQRKQTLNGLETFQKKMTEINDEMPESEDEDAPQHDNDEQQSQEEKLMPDDLPPEYKRAIMDLNSQFKASSYLGEDWSNPRLDSSQGWHMGHSRDAQDAESQWLEFHFPDDQVFEVSKMLMMKRADRYGPWWDLAKGRVLQSFSLMYSIDDDNWEPYKNEQEIPTGQLESDDHTTLRQIEFDPPFSAKKVKITFKRIHSSDFDIDDPQKCHNMHGRFDFIVKPDDSSEKKSTHIIDEMPQTEDEQGPKDESDKDVALDDKKQETKSITSEKKDSSDHEKSEMSYSSIEDDDDVHPTGFQKVELSHLQASNELNFKGKLNFDKKSNGKLVQVSILVWPKDNQGKHKFVEVYENCLRKSVGPVNVDLDIQLEEEHKSGIQLFHVETFQFSFKTSQANILKQIENTESKRPDELKSCKLLAEWKQN